MANWIKRLLFGKKEPPVQAEPIHTARSARKSVAPKPFVAIDFETVNRQRSSACAVGFAVVDSGQIVESGSYFIRPHPFEFDPYFTRINGITPEMVDSAPQFIEVWQNEIVPRITNKSIVAHNASYDISVLRHALDVTKAAYPQTNYYCTRIFAQSVWPGWGDYQLNTIADYLKIDFQHHDPEDDAVVCAKIALRICQEKGVTDLERLGKLLKYRPGKLLAHSYKSSKRSSGDSSGAMKWAKYDLKDITPEVDTFDQSHPFFQQYVLFTGNLQAMSRREAAQAVVNAGGICPSSMSAKVNYLVIGEQDYKLLADGKKSTKLKRAQELIAQGKNIQIISEEEFLEMIE